jgi:hypothetical protein
LDISSEEIKHLNVDVLSTSNLKSDYNYIRVLFGKLNKLETLNLNILNSGDLYNPTNEGRFTKNFIKGINNFKNAGGKLLHLKIFLDVKTTFGSEEMKTNSIWNILDKFNDLRSLDCSDTHLNQYAVQKIRNHFYQFKTIHTLILTNCNLSDATIKDLSDGMMKAKNIENIFLNKNILIKSISGIINNLAFQPSLKVLNIGENSGLTDVDELIIALTKMLKMSPSIETLICNSIPLLNYKLNIEFYSSLGDNNSLKFLDLNNSGQFNYTNLAQSIAMNALKRGNLEVLKIAGQFNYIQFETFIKGLYISEEIHNKFYGSNINPEILKDTKEYYEKKFYNNLKYLDISNSNLLTNINLNDVKNKCENDIKNLLENSKNLQKICFDNCLCNKYFVELLNNALQYPNNLKILKMNNFLKNELTKLFMNSFFKKNESGNGDGDEDEDNDNLILLNENNKLEKLDLSNNNFGYSGIESLCKVLKINKSLKSLNLYKNLFDVNGARRLSESLLHNQTLEILDIGYNRIRDLGFKNIIESLITNKNSNLKEISFRCNFIKEEIINKMIPLLDKENNKLVTCNLSNNLISEISSNRLYEILYKENSSKINSDIFIICHYNNPDRLERCAWISTVNINISKIKVLEAIENCERALLSQENTHMGVVLDIKFFKGRRFITKNTKGVVEGNRIFVEFVDPNSVNRLLKIASTTGFCVDSTRLKCFKAGNKKEVVIPKKKLQK